MNAGVPNDALEAGLRRVARADRLLVVSDFDGTLAGIVDHPDAVVPDRSAVAALRELARLPGTTVAVLSGRSREVLVKHLGHTGLTLVGSHGAERGDVETPADEATRALLERTGEALDGLAAEYEGSLVERKPTGVAFHYRQVEEARRREAAARAEALAEESHVLRVQPGHMVVELVTGDANKGDALDALRDELEPTATVFVGDDRTDEHAFARLSPSDLAVKIGPGATCAPFRIPAQKDVAGLFRRLHSLRAVRPAPAGG